MQPGDHLILIIEDEPPIRRFLRASLTNEGYRLNEAASGEEGLRVASSQPPDLVILDLGLPDIDGHEVLRQLREWLAAPIIILSARDQEMQKIKALDNGADDYVTKPFGIGELLARIRTAIRHAYRVEPESSTVSLGDLRVDLAGHRVFSQGGGSSSDPAGVQTAGDTDQALGKGLDPPIPVARGVGTARQSGEPLSPRLRGQVCAGNSRMIRHVRGIF